MAKKFKIELHKGFEVYAKLKIKEDKGYLKFFWQGKEIGKDVGLDNFSPALIKHYIKQAELICLYNQAKLWSY